jgi:hypothetical protein
MSHLRHSRLIRSAVALLAGLAGSLIAFLND